MCVVSGMSYVSIDTKYGILRKFIRDYVHKTGMLKKSIRQYVHKRKHAKEINTSAWTQKKAC